MSELLASRVQRICEGETPVVHLEPEVPAGEWPLRVDGAVETPLLIGPQEFRGFDTIERHADLHCVWGWSKPGERWEGFHLNALSMRARPLPEARYVLVSACVYGSCFKLEEARDGIFAWRGLSPERGWPLRFVAASYMWGYKSVKWVERVTFLEEFQPGLWESRVGDPKGDIPWDVLQRFDGAAQRWRVHR